MTHSFSVYEESPSVLRQNEARWPAGRRFNFVIHHVTMEAGAAALYLALDPTADSIHWRTCTVVPS